MGKIKLLGWLVLIVLPMKGYAQLTDRILLGNEQSEEAHGLTTYCPEKTVVVTDGFLGQTGRYCTRFVENPFCGDYPGIYGGEYCFVLKVDGSAQNYLTLRTNGGDGVTMQERYRVQVDNKDLTDYSRDAVSFDANKAPGAFSYNTLIIPRKITDNKSYVVVRVRSAGRYYGYGKPGVFETYQRVMEGDMPPIYAIYSSTNPMFDPLADEPTGTIPAYADSPVKSSCDLEELKQDIIDGFNKTMKDQIAGSDFKPAYGNNNFNIVEVMGTAYQKSYYGVDANQLAAKIRVAIDSMVFINNLTKRGIVVSRSVLGNSATEQKASAGWGGLYGEQGYGMYQLWLAGKITDYYLDQKVDLGAGTDKTRREQWIEVFKESFDVGCSYNGRRFITNQIMEAAYSVYGASLALYALDNNTYHNAPKLGLRFLREAVGVDLWTGVPVNSSFDGSLKDKDGYPDFELGSSQDMDSQRNFWGIDFQVMTEKGNGREAGWTCTSCYGNMGPRVVDLYLMTMLDPYIGQTVGGEGDKDILAKAVQNEKSQSYFTYPWTDSDGYKQMTSESAICWRNRYEPGKAYYNNLIVAGISGDEELLGHVWQSCKEGNLAVFGDMQSNLFNYYSRNYWLPECIDKLISFGRAHENDYTCLPSVPQGEDYVYGDEQVGIVAVKYGTTQLFVNFYSESSLSSCGRVHIITPQMVKNIAFIPEVMDYVPSGQKETIADVYWNGNHKITYPDNPQMADGGSVYDIPAYDRQPGHYNSMRTMCDYYQQQFGAFLVAQNTTAGQTYQLKLTEKQKGQKAVDIATGEEVILNENISVGPRTSVAYYIMEFNGNNELDVSTTEKEADRTELIAKVNELLPFACKVSQKLSVDKKNDHYSRDAFMPFFKELTFANFVAHTKIADQQMTDSTLSALNKAYDALVATYYEYDACQIPGDIDYQKKVSQSGSLQVKSKTSLVNAMNNAWVVIPITVNESGDYTVKIKAKGHVYDAKEPSLNIDFYTDEQFQTGNMPLNNYKTQQIAYNMFDYDDYQWQVHLNAGETKLLKLTFLANENGYTVDLGKMTISLATMYDVLQQQIARADSLYNVYKEDELVEMFELELLTEAKERALLVKETDDENVISKAVDDLKSAINRFELSLPKRSYTIADIQFRINNTTQSGDGATFEVRNSSKQQRDYGFVGALKFDISDLLNKEDAQIQSATLTLTTIERGCRVSVRPFSSDWGETGGSTDSYVSKQAYIKAAIDAEEITSFSAVLGGGRKMFEWIPDKNYQYTVKDWQVNCDVKDYLISLVSEGQSTLGLLLVPADENDIRTVIVCKDACESTFGTSTTDDYYLSGELIGQKTGQQVSRWARVVQVLNQDHSLESALFPTLTVKYQNTDGVHEIQIKGDIMQMISDKVYSMDGNTIKIDKKIDLRRQLKSGIYIVDGKKILIK